MKTSVSLWQYYRDEPTDVGAIDGFPGNSPSFKCKQNIIDKTTPGSTKNVKIMVPLKHLSTFRRTLEMSLINCEINLILTWPANCVITSLANQTTKFAITDKKL